MNGEKIGFGECGGGGMLEIKIEGKWEGGNWRGKNIGVEFKGGSL